MAKKQAFKNSDAAYAWAFNAGDAAQVAALYSKDAIFMMPETPASKGTKGVRAQAQAGIDAGWRNIKFKTIKSGSDGDLAFNTHEGARRCCSSACTPSRVKPRNVKIDPGSKPA